MAKKQPPRRAAAESIAATDAAKNFGRLVDRVREEGATYVIERHGRPMAQIGPVASSPKKTLRAFVNAMRAAPKLDDETLRHIEEAVATHNRPAVPRNPWER